MTRPVPSLSGLAGSATARWTAALVVLVGSAVGVNLRWLAGHRRGLPLDIDEAGYLQRAVLDGSALSRGVRGFVSVLRQGDPQAPMLPAAAGVVRHVTGAGPYRLLAVPQAFYALAVVATYLLARRLTSRGWALLGGGVVAAAPGMLIASRQFGFAVPLTALLTATIAAQLATSGFRSLRRSLVWGVLLGLTALTRTQALGLLPPLLLAAALRLAVTRAGPVAVRNAMAGLATAMLCSAWWYAASWRAVITYLADYGYGRHSVGYGPAHRPWSVAWWTARPGNLLNSVLFAPLAGALLVCLGCGVVRLVAERGSRPITGASLRALLGTDAATVAIVLAGGYLALSSTRNTGSYFVLPLMPALVVLAVSAAAGSPPGARRLASTICMLAAATSFAGQNALPGVPSQARLAVGAARLTVFNGLQPPTAYTSAFRGHCPAATMCTIRDADEPPREQLRRWVPPSRAMAAMLASWAIRHGRDPVVFFAVQDPLFNTNTVDLAYALAYGSALPTGLLQDPVAAGRSLVEQLDAPSLGLPNLVISGTASAVPAAQAFAPRVDDSAVQGALRLDGFAEVDQLTLPDGRVMHVWWHVGRGPRHVGPP